MMTFTVCQHPVALYGGDTAENAWLEPCIYVVLEGGGAPIKVYSKKICKGSLIKQGDYQSLYCDIDIDLFMDTFVSHVFASVNTKYFMFYYMQ